jgi:hypothetical protein
VQMHEVAPHGVHIAYGGLLLSNCGCVCSFWQAQCFPSAASGGCLPHCCSGKLSSSVTIL